LEGEDLETALQSLAPLSKDFAEVGIYIESAQVTLIPEGLYDQESLHSYLPFIYSTDPGHCFSTRASTLDAYWVFALEATTEELLYSLFPQAHIQHCAAPILEGLLREPRQEGAFLLHVHCMKKKALIMASSGRTLRNLHIFDIAHGNDLIYHLANTKEQLEESHERCIISYSGELKEGDALLGLISRFFAEARPMSPWGVQELFGAEIPKETWRDLDLYNHRVCG
jgi:hypothetical protein